MKAPDGEHPRSRRGEAAGRPVRRDAHDARPSSSTGRTSPSSRTSRRCAIASTSSASSEPIVTRQGVEPHRRAAAGRAGSERGDPRARRDRDAGVPAGRRDQQSLRGGEHASACRSARSSTSERDGRPILLKRDIIATGEQLTDANSGLPGRPAAGQREARCARRAVDAQRDARTTSAGAWPSSTSRKKQLAEGEQCKGVRIGADLHRGRRHQRGDDPERAVVAASASPACRPTEARELALLLRSGALAAPQTIVEQRSVGPSLGAGQHPARLAGDGASACC